MTVYHWLILALWAILLLYWAISAVGAKRNVNPRAWRRSIGWRVAIIILLLIALRIPAVSHAMREMVLAVGAYRTGTGMLAGVIGVGVCALGVALALWARIYLGRNWGMPMARKEAPELVTTGPYALIRHPIYSGFLLAVLGSAIAGSPAWLLPLVLLGAYFFYSARTEEKFMSEQFPQDYPAYKRRTKALIPFLW